MAELDRKIRWYRNTSTAGEPVLAAAVTFKARGGGDFVADNVRVDIADWNGDGLPDAIIGSGAGDVKIAYNVGTANAPVLDAPTTIINSSGRT